MEKNLGKVWKKFNAIGAHLDDIEDLMQDLFDELNNSKKKKKWKIKN